MKEQRKSRAGRRWVLLIFLSLLGTPLAHGAAAVRVIKPPYQNQILREYYQARLQHQPWTWGDPAGSAFIAPEANSAELDRRVDLLIDDFTEKLIEKLGRLQEEQREVEEKRLELLSLSEPERIPALRQWRVSIEKLKDRADDLHDFLSPIFDRLDSKSDFETIIGDRDLPSLFDRQVAALREEVSRATALIQDYFLRPTFLVDVDTLQHGNMLITLDRTRKLAEELADFLKKKAARKS